MKLIIDRLEDGWAVCEYAEGKTIDLPVLLLPPEAKEGDVLRLVVDTETTTSRKRRAEELRKQLFKRK